MVDHRGVTPCEFVCWTLVGAGAVQPLDSSAALDQRVRAAYKDPRARLVFEIVHLLCADVTGLVKATSGDFDDVPSNIVERLRDFKKSLLPAVEQCSRQCCSACHT